MPLEEIVNGLRLAVAAALATGRMTSQRRGRRQLVLSCEASWAAGGSSRSRRHANHIPSTALPIAKQVTTKVAAVFSGRLCTTQASKGDSPLSTSINQNKGLRGW
jgi:hypothetical protein